MIDSKQHRHKISISGPVINFEIKVDGVIAAQIYQGLAKLPNVSELQKETQENNQSALPLGIGHLLSPQEYLIDVKAKTNPEKILAFVKYLTDKGVDSVELTELKLLFQKAREPIPANFGRDLVRAVRYGWVTPASDAGKYYVTNMGEQILKLKFNMPGAIRAKSSRKVGKNTFIEAPFRKEVEDMEMDPVMEGFPDFGDLSTSSDKVLWLLEKAKTLGVDKLNQKELSKLSEKIGSFIPRTSISSLIKQHVKKKRIFTPLEVGVKYLKIQSEGEKYLKTIKK